MVKVRYQNGFVLLVAVCAAALASGCLKLKNPSPSTSGGSPSPAIEPFRYLMSGVAGGWRTDFSLAWSRPWGVAVKQDAPDQGDIFYTSNGSVIRLSSEGTLKGWIGGGRDGWHQGSISPGASAGSFGMATKAAIANGYLYVTDAKNSRVARWTVDEGVFSGWIGGGLSGWQTTDGAAVSGTGLGFFSSPYGSAVDGSGNLYVTEYGNHRIQKWNAGGVFQGWVGNADTGAWRTTFEAPAAGAGDGQFKGPVDVIYDSVTDRLYVAEAGATGNCRIQKWTTSGDYEGWIGGGSNGWKTGAGATCGDGDALFNTWVYALAVDSSGKLYAADNPSNHIAVWDLATGAYLHWYGNGVDGPSTGAGARYEGVGTNQGYYGNLKGLGIDRSSNQLYVALMGRGLHRLSTAGVTSGWYDSIGTPGWQTGALPGDGIMEGRWVLARSAARDPDGNFYLSEYVSSVSMGSAAYLKRYDSDGNYLGWIGGGQDGWQTSDPTNSRGTTHGYLQAPAQFGFDDTQIYVTDSSSHWVQIWTRTGNRVGWLGGGSDGINTGAAPASSGAARSFNNPAGIAVDSAQGYLYVADRLNHRIQRWTTSGVSSQWLGGGVAGWQLEAAAPVSGAGDAAFNTPNGLALSGGKLYVCDSANNRVQKWDVVSGAYEGWIGGGQDGWQTGTASGGTGDRFFKMDTYGLFTCGIAVDPEGTFLYVTDYDNYRVQKWVLSSGAYVGWMGGGSDDWVLGEAPLFIGAQPLNVGYSPTGIIAGPDGDLYLWRGTSGGNPVLVHYRQNP
ncbi:MAG: hypothetical protein IT285_12865 [Bdellovibrionales bacterium]|nr:hypothetical protein [Bdellovibrionales bacterium]